MTAPVEIPQVLSARFQDTAQASSKGIEVFCSSEKKRVLRANDL